jgi:hypothetical protein
MITFLFSCPPILKSNLIQIENEFRWATLHELRNAEERLIQTTTRNLEALGFLWGTFHLAYFVDVPTDKGVHQTSRCGQVILHRHLFAKVAARYRSSFRGVLGNPG